MASPAATRPPSRGLFVDVYKRCLDRSLQMSQQQQHLQIGLPILMGEPVVEPQPPQDEDKVVLVGQPLQVLDKYNNDNVLVEIALEDVLRNLLANDALKDITLQGTDGYTVGAQRCVLAARSRVFAQMLFGELSTEDFGGGKNSEIINIMYPGTVLEAVVEYIYTNHAGFFDDEISDEDDASSEKFARNLVSLADAAVYFELPNLQCKVLALIAGLISQKSALVGYIYAAAYELNEEQVSPVCALVVQGIRMNPKILLEGTALRNISYDQLDHLMEDHPNMFVDDYTMFLILEKWANVQDVDVLVPATSPAEEIETSENALAKEARKTKVASLMQYITLECINPADLAGHVTHSGLVPDRQLLDAFAAQALSSQQDVIARYPPIWQSCNGQVYDCTSTAFHPELLRKQWTMKFGVYVWKIKVEVLCVCTWMGVATDVLPLVMDKGLGRQAGGWMYGNNGAACHNQDKYTSNIFPMFAEGSVVTFVLDLTGEGTLNASVDGGPMAPLFDKMITELQQQGHEHPGFLPAVSLKAPARVRFLGFQV